MRWLNQSRLWCQPFKSFSLYFPPKVSSKKFHMNFFTFFSVWWILWNSRQYTNKNLNHLAWVMRVAVSSNYSRRANQYLIQSLLGFVYVTSYSAVLRPSGGKNGRDILVTTGTVNWFVCIWYLIASHGHIAQAPREQWSTRRLLTYAPLF